MRRAMIGAAAAVAACASPAPDSARPLIAAWEQDLARRCVAAGAGRLVIPFEVASRAADLNADSQADYLLHGSRYRCERDATLFASAGLPCAGDAVLVSSPRGYGLIEAGCVQVIDIGTGPVRLEAMRRGGGPGDCAEYACAVIYVWRDGRFVREDGTPGDVLTPRPFRPGRR